MKNTHTKSDSEILRQKAEELMRLKSSGIAASLSEIETLKLIHELEVHQVELELQNDELRQAWAEAEVANDKYIRLYDFAPSGYFTLSGNGEIIELNLSGAKMLGKDRQHLKNRLFRFFVSEETKSIFRLFLERAFKSKSKESCEVTMDSAGSLPFHVFLTGVVSENGEQCFVSAFDITERRRLESIIKTRNLILELSYHCSLDELLIKTLDEVEILSKSKISFLHFVEDDQATLSLQVWSTNTLQKMCSADGKGQHYPIDQAGVWVDCIAARSPVIHNDYLSLPHRKGLPAGHVPVIRELVVPIFRNEKIVAILGVGNKESNYDQTDVQSISEIADIVWDIAERKKGEEELRQSRERYQKDLILLNSILESPVNIIIFSLDKNYCYTAFTTFHKETIKKIWGVEISTGMNMLDIISNPEDRQKAKNNFDRALKGEHFVLSEAYGDELLYRTFYDDYYSPVKDGDGNITGVSVFVIDITERKQSEQELLKAKAHAEESDHLKSAFLANMSHEIRTPMNGIMGFARLLKEPGLTGEDQQKYIRIIEKSGKRMLNIINDIVDISKIESGLMELGIAESNINEQIEYIYTFFKPEVEAKGIHFFFKNSLSAKEAIIETDREKIYAILTNLVKNAIKYTNEGSIEFGYEKKGEFLEFFVKDTGIGIAKNRQESIFERFVQADIFDTQAYQGAGLGLSITKAYVGMMGGEIWVKSDEGIGSIFYFTIPYNTKKQGQGTTANVSQEDESGQIKNLKILIAEDEETSDLLLTAMLKEISREVIHARTGGETVDACRNNPDLDLILMDIRMPGLNGYDATRQIRKFNKEIIIIAQTAYALSGDRQKAIDTGCNEYLSKPIDKDELLRLMHKYFTA